MDGHDFPEQIATMVGGYRASADAERLKYLLLDTIGVAIAGAHEAAPRAVRSVTPCVSAVNSSTVIASSTSDPISASAANAVAAHVLDYDDTHSKSLVHVSSTVVPAVLSLAEFVDASLEEMIEAYGLGMRITAFFERLGPLLNGAGVHATAILGAVAGAGAGAWLLTGDPTATARAAQLAAGTGLGLCENFGSGAKSLQVGVAAANGTRAALLARVGSDSGDALFGTRGVFCVTLGEDAREYGRWGDPCDDAVGVLASKPYPCCYLLHPAIDAALEVWSQLDGRPDVEVQSAQVTIGPLAASLANRPAKVGDPLSAKFSAAYCVAQTLSAGHLTVADLREPSQNETVTLTECLDRLTVTIDDCLSPLEAGLRVRLKSGDLLTAHVTGTPSDKRPMSEDELQAKFRDNVSALLTREDALALEDRLTAMSTSGSARQIFSGLRFAR